MLPHPDVLIVGAGVMGLSLALELQARGLRAAVCERGVPLAQASSAAAGMLAVEDPHNPPALFPLARWSGTLYPVFLSRLEALSGLAVPFQTDTAWQTMPGGTVRRLSENSIDPRQLASALLAAVTNSGIPLQPSPGARCDMHEGGAAVVYTTGAWSSLGLPVSPRKGQMLRVSTQPFALTDVYRNEHVYVVPRTRGPQAGSALIGATVEDAGFDTSTVPEALQELRLLAAELVHEMADLDRAPTLEAWAGLRPATPDGLPILGELGALTRPETSAPRQFVATGHFRNGILLAPATAVALADLIEGRPLAIDLDAFSPARFATAASAASPSR